MRLLKFPSSVVMPMVYIWQPLVVALGMPEDFDEMIAHLKRHADGASEHTQLPNSKGRPDIDLLLLPVCTDHAAPFIVLQERIVHQLGRPNMELMIGGSREAFVYLAEQFRLMREPDGKSGSIRIEAHNQKPEEPVLAHPWVRLDIRRAVRSWKKKDVGMLAGHFGAGPFNPDPPHQHWESGVVVEEKSYPYMLPTYDDLFAKLPRKRKSK